MKELFQYQDYRDFLEFLVGQRDSRKFTRSSLARAMGCQAAYFSQVLKGRASLTEEHGIKLCVYLGFNEVETDYFMVILRLGRSGHQVLTQYLEGQRKRLKRLGAEVDAKISKETNRISEELSHYYCSSWIPSTIHLATSCSSYQTVGSLAQRFGLQKEMVEFHLSMLEKYSLVKFGGHRWSFNGDSIHISKGSAQDLSFQTNNRIRSLSAIQARKERSVHYSALLSLDERTANEIREKVIETISDLLHRAEPAPAEEVYSVCIDFFQT